jgi:hypothetical protein
LNDVAERLFSLGDTDYSLETLLSQSHGGEELSGGELAA